ncbi:MFS general substrate transporter [Neurospora crassa]|uniref:Siderophore iron transporter n=1 Tax=Neurospora crassa (strain ATCC 24698 / 74-OR23-1A / CBS 708.71 / DSM 1257 / FGSC 987) TaxID=367110 RepID=Q7S5F6_NEUCR|nr:siderophore iron transporter [Neurospora crassa OR74A]EAA30758.1 siderophore iron transporter [Neurospora crassa OR74A]KHE81297.1 MFS general substrate transporter [Neurospora crassa]|eukprot:XP_959994.1 siderophore iron transporter [Neurospora crassa OR74A]
MRSLLHKLGRPAAPADIVEEVQHNPNDKEAAVGTTSATNASDPGAETDSSQEISKEAQAGIQRVEAMTKVWTRNDMYMAYITIWILYFVDALQSGMSTSFYPYVTSSFALHSLTATTSIMSSLIGGLFKLPLAKILDIWGRPQGFCAMLGCLTIGLIMMAGCNGVKTYAAAQVFYWVGYNGLTYSISIFLADTSALKNRALLFAFVSSPYIITCWISGIVAQRFLDGPGWRWGYGAFAIIVPAVCSPILWLFYKNHVKAKKAGLLPKHESKGNFWQTLKFYVIEFDILGLLLITTGLALFLLSFNLYSYQKDQWKSPLIICFLIFGGLLMIAFALYEKFLAPKTFIPYQLLMDRTVISACILAGALFVSFYIWDSYFSSFLQVVNNLDVVKTSYVVNVYSVGSCFWSLLVGWAVRKTNRFKWLAVYFGVPVTILGVGLMIHFRQPNENVGYIVMCQIFIATAGGTLVICEQMAVMAATSHEFIAVVLAIEAMFSNVGGAIGSTVASAIWTGVFPKHLAKYLPASEQQNLTAIYGSIVTQLSYPYGSETRNAIARAYGDSQKYMLIAATAIQAISMVSVLFWRDIKLDNVKQNKGLVF